MSIFKNSFIERHENLARTEPGWVQCCGEKHTELGGEVRSDVECSI